MCMRHRGSASANFHILSVSSFKSLPALNPSFHKHCDSSSPRLCWWHQAATASIIPTLPLGVLGSIGRIVVELNDMGVGGTKGCMCDGIPHCCMNWYIAGEAWDKGEGRSHGKASREKLAGSAYCNWFTPFGVRGAWAQSMTSPIWSFGLKKLLPKGMQV